MAIRIRLYLTQPLTWVKIVVLLTYLILVLTYCSKYEMNLSSLINIGQQDVHYSSQTINKGFVVFHNAGYDGQYNYYIAKDFFLKGNFPDSFRYQRVLYPYLAYLLSFGNLKYVPYTFILINLLSIWLGMEILIRLMGIKSDFNLFLMALYALNIGFLVSFLYDLGTPLAIFFILAGFYYFQKDNVNLSAIFLGLSLLTMENAWLVVTPLFLWVIWKKEYNKTLILLCSIIPWIIWQLALGWKFHQIPIFASAGFLSFPFMGIIDYFKTHPWHANSITNLVRQIDIIPFMFFILFTLLLSAIQLYKEKSIYAWIVLFHCLFALFLSYQHIWSHTITSASRVLSGLFPFLFLLYIHSREKRLLSILIAWAWFLTLLGLIRVAFLPQHAYFIVMK